MEFFIVVPERTRRPSHLHCDTPRFSTRPRPSPTPAIGARRRLRISHSDSSLRTFVRGSLPSSYKADARTRMDWLENCLQRELNLAGRPCPYRARVNGCDDVAEHPWYAIKVRRDIRLREPVLWVIENIKELRTKLEMCSLGQRNILPQAQVHLPCARATFRGVLPNVPFAGAANAAGLIHSVKVAPPGGVSETPGTRSGR
jgi:hypothetical protein